MPVKAKQPSAKRQVKFVGATDSPPKRSASPQDLDTSKRARVVQKSGAKIQAHAAKSVAAVPASASARSSGRVTRGVGRGGQLARAEPGYVVVERVDDTATPAATARTSDTPTLDSAEEDGMVTDTEANPFLDLEAEEDNSIEDEGVPVSSHEEDAGDTEPEEPAATSDASAVVDDPELRSLIDKLTDDPVLKGRLRHRIMSKISSRGVPRNGDRVVHAPDNQIVDPGAAPLPAGGLEVAQTRLPPAFAPDDSGFDGATTCLDASIWAPVLRKMYRSVVPPPRVIQYKGRMTGAELSPPNFQRWASQTGQLAFMLRALSFSSNAHYVNLSRARWSDFEIVDTQSPGRPLRFLARKRSKTPVLCISLVQVVKSTLLRPAQVARKTGDGWLDKKTLIANLFAQELELLICTLGCTYGADLIKLPSWASAEATRGLTFQTRLSPSSTGPTTTTKRRGLYAPDDAPSSAVSKQTPTQLSANNIIPVFDSTVEGFDLSAPFADIVRQPAMQDEPPPESVGVVFYTVTDQGSEHTIDFNVQAFAWVAHDQHTVFDNPPAEDDPHGLDSA